MSTSSNFPTIKPTLSLDFARVNALDSRITFARSSSATFFDSGGILRSAANNVPRFDYDASTQIPKGLLIEEQRTNLFNNSNDFTTWTKQTNGTGVVGITANSILSPDGTTNATRYFVQTSGGTFYSLFRGGVSISANTSYTYSTFIKSGEVSVGNLTIFDGGGIATSSFNFNTGGLNSTIQSANTTISSASSINVGNGWYRYFLAFSSVSSGFFQFKIDLATTTQDQGIYIYGSQLEAGAFPTSYIPTTASQVTRSVDTAAITDSNFTPWFNATEGTLFVDSTFYYQASAGYPQMLALVGTDPNLDAIRIYTQTTGVGSPTTNGLIAGSITSGGTDSMDYLPSGQTIFGQAKAALGYKTNDSVIIANGIGFSTGDTSVTLPTVNALRIFGTGRYQLTTSGWIRKVSYYPLRLTNAQMVGLTR